MKPGIVFTGGGTAGHVVPNVALIEALMERGWKIDYIGSKTGVEGPMIEALGLPFHAVSTGKLRRYWSLQNFIDPFKILLGTLQSFNLLRKIKPKLLFSKGGFVGFPVVFAAWLLRIPVLAHESDLSPGLANRLCFPFVSKLCLTAETSKSYFKRQDKLVVTGSPIRAQLFNGDKAKAMHLCKFKEDKPCILVVGGSLGAESLNTAVRNLLATLTQEFNLIHLCGKGKIDPSLANHPGYCQFEYAKGEMADLMAAADLVISRSGANALYEILALAKPHILVPLPLSKSRGDQLQNAHYYEKKGVSRVLTEEKLNPQSLLSTIKQVFAEKDALKTKMETLGIESAVEAIVELIEAV